METAIVYWGYMALMVQQTETTLALQAQAPDLHKLSLVRCAGEAKKYEAVFCKRL